MMDRSFPTAVLALALMLALTSGVGCASFQGAKLYRSGTLALERGETQRAIADLERAAVLVPDASEVHNHLGLAYSAAGRTLEATDAFQYAVDLACDNLAAQQNLRAAQGR